MEPFGKTMSPLYSRTGERRKFYEQGIRDTILLLGFSKIDDAQPGTVTRTETLSAKERYFPSMLALQLYLESDTVMHDGSVLTLLPIAPADETPEQENVRIGDALAKMVQATYGNDVLLQPGTGSAIQPVTWAEKIVFQTDYSYVYDALRHRVLVSRDARRDALLTRALEKTVLDKLLTNAQIKDEVAALQAKCTDAFVATEGDIAGSVQLATAAVVAYINDVLYARFIEIAKTDTFL